MTSRLPRALHPAAWWVWALATGTAASRTTNPIYLGLIIAVLGFVVARRRPDAPWARGFRAYLVMGIVIVVTRVLFRALLDGQHGAHILFTLPEIPLPDGAAGIQIGGPVSAEGLLAALYDGLRLATLILCVGAANTLANPKRLLKSLPSALHEIGVSVTVALSVAPQLVESGLRVHRARKLRGDSDRGARAFARRVALPVLTDALDRSLLLAAAMDTRGYGRRNAVTRGARRMAGLLVIIGLGGVCVGVYGLLDATTPVALGLPMLGAGLLVAGTGFTLTGRRVSRTVYRPDPWRFPEWGVTASGLSVAAAFVAISSLDPAALNPPVQPLTWPAIDPGPTLVLLVGALPAWIAPPPVFRPIASPASERVPTSAVAS